MRYIKKCILPVVILIIIGLAVCILPWQHKIDTSLKGIQCRIGNTEEYKEVSLDIKGVFKQYLFRNNTFNGTIVIDGYDFTSDGSNVSLIFSDAWAGLTYFNVKDGMPIQNTLGTICCTPDFKQVLICISEPVDSDSKSWSGENGIFISAPSDNRSQALEIAKQLSAKSAWLSHTTWN